MKIIALQAENIKRLSAVEVHPKSSTVVVGGKNAAGKTSVLDSIAYALGGKALLPSEPLRRGQKSGHVTVTLDGDQDRNIPPLAVTRTFSAKGTSSLKICTTDGMAPTSPQTLLDGLCGKIAFDPLEFSRMSPSKQADILRKLVGLDFAELDTKRGQEYDARTAVNREAKTLKARFDAAQHYEDAPDVEVSVSKLVAELQNRQNINVHNANERKVLEDHEAENRTLWQTVQDHETRIAQLENELRSERTSFRQWKQQAVEDDDALGKHRQSVEALEDADMVAIETQITESETVNQQVRANRARMTLAKQYETLSKESQRITDVIESLDKSRQDQLAAAEWPIEGIGFREDGITFKDLPFEQASSAEQLRIAVAIGLALNPTLRVLLIRDGSLLDADNLRMLAEMAEAADAQVWIERVGEGDECAVIIEDGSVVES